MDNDHQEHPQCINEDMSLTTCDLLSGVVSRGFTTLGSPNRLAVDDSNRRCCFFACRFPNFITKEFMDCQPNSVKLPLAKYPVDRILVSKIFGKESPMAPCAADIQNGVDDSPPIDSFSSTLIGRG